MLTLYTCMVLIRAWSDFAPDCMERAQTSPQLCGSGNINSHLVPNLFTNGR